MNKVILIGNLAVAAVTKYGGSARISMMVDNEADGDMLDDIFPKQMGRYIAEAILKEPDWEADEADIKAAIQMVGGIDI